VRWLDWDDSLAEVGYWTVAEARGRGIATRAVRLVTRWALRDVGVVRMQLRAAAENEASQRVAERAGFVKEGVLRSARFDRRAGKRRDFVLYSLLRDDLE
jgi:RimJ/RimL family protein N-acetyltransferase